MNITPIIEAIIAISVSLITGYLIPFLKAKYSAESLHKALDVIDIVVAAAEQIGKNLGYDGAAKKAYVVSRLEDLGYKINDATLDYIEASVLELHNALTE